MQLKQQNDGNINEATLLYSSIQEELSIILFILLYHQVSCLDYYYEFSNKSHSAKSGDQGSNNGQTAQFELSNNLKEYLLIPFSLNPSISTASTASNGSAKTMRQQEASEIKQLEKQQLHAFEINYKLNNLIKMRTDDKLLMTQSLNQDGFSNEYSIRHVLDKKFRLYWNFNWHGGSLLKLCNDLIYDEQLIQNKNSDKYEFIRFYT